MIAIDTNILVYAFRHDSGFNEPAVRLVTGLAEGSAPWAIPWPCAYEFLRVVTHPRVFSPPSMRERAIDRLVQLRRSPSLTFLGQGPSHLTNLIHAAESSGAKGNLFFDVHIAALCKEHGVTEILTMDRDFARFAGLKARRPFS